MQTERPRLLVVDDDRSILTLIGTIALAEGFDVATTTNGEEAMKQLRSRPAELVLPEFTRDERGAYRSPSYPEARHHVAIEIGQGLGRVEARWVEGS